MHHCWIFLGPAIWIDGLRRQNLSIRRRHCCGFPKKYSCLLWWTLTQSRERKSYKTQIMLIASPISKKNIHNIMVSLTFPLLPPRSCMTGPSGGGAGIWQGAQFGSWSKVLIFVAFWPHIRSWYVVPCLLCIWLCWSPWVRMLWTGAIEGTGSQSVSASGDEGMYLYNDIMICGNMITITMTTMIWYFEPTLYWRLVTKAKGRSGRVAGLQSFIIITIMIILKWRKVGLQSLIIIWGVIWKR